MDGDWLPAGVTLSSLLELPNAMRELLRDLPRAEFASGELLAPIDAWQWSMNFAGVGPMTASIVLLFTYQQPLFLVDTHIHRVTLRLGWIPQNANAEQAHDPLGALISSQLYYRLHINLIEHGRAICHARGPQCERCPLSDVCAYYQKNGK